MGDEASDWDMSDGDFDDLLDDLDNIDAKKKDGKKDPKKDPKAKPGVCTRARDLCHRAIVLVSCPSCPSCLAPWRWPF